MVKTLTREIAKNLYLLRLDDRDVKYFEALWYIPEGITYNAYLYLGSNNYILFDTWKVGYSDLFIETLRDIADPRSIDHIVVHHMEPDHSGALKALVELNPRVKILGHPLVKSMLESFYNIRNFTFKPVRDLEEVEIGNARLKFIHVSWLHWPETIMSYLYNTKTLFSGDAFGGFSIPESIFGERLSSSYIEFMRKYFVNVIGYYRRHVEKNINKILKLGLDIELIAPLHGALWKDIHKIVDYYIKWSRGESIDKKITIIYSSMYGFVEKAILVVVELLKKRGFNLKIYKVTDKHRSEISDILSDVIDSVAIVLGAATYEGSIFPYMEYIINQIVRKANASKPVIIVSSYGWGGVAGKLIRDYLSNTNFKILEVIEFKGSLNENVMEKIEKVVQELSNTI